jgi:hypothetical protein
MPQAIEAIAMDALAQVFLADVVIGWVLPLFGLHLGPVSAGSHAPAICKFYCRTGAATMETLVAVMVGAVQHPPSCRLSVSVA